MRPINKTRNNNVAHIVLLHDHCVKHLRQFQIALPPHDRVITSRPLCELFTAYQPHKLIIDWHVCDITAILQSTTFIR